MDCARVRASGIRRLENLHSADHRIYGEGKCGVYLIRVVWLYGEYGGSHEPSVGHKLAGVLPSVYAMCGGCLCGEEGAGRKMGRGDGHRTMYDRLGNGLDCENDRIDCELIVSQILC